jgi:hypothetical protein
LMSQGLTIIDDLTLDSITPSAAILVRGG